MARRKLKRREVVGFVAGALTLPITVRAQQQPIPTTGYLSGSNAGASKTNLAGFRQGLRQTGYIEGQNLHIAFRWADGRFDRFAELAAELVALPVAVIAA